MIKRGMSATYEEWLMSAEYVMAGGNENVILCERGIRTFESYTRNTLDLAGIPVLRKLTHLPIIIDPSHATGKSWLVEPLAMGAVAAGADGLHDRGPQRPGPCPVRRPPVSDAGGVRRPGEEAAEAP